MKFEYEIAGCWPSFLTLKKVINWLKEAGFSHANITVLCDGEECYWLQYAEGRITFL